MCVYSVRKLFAFETIFPYDKNSTYYIYFVVEFETKRVLLDVVSLIGVNFYLKPSYRRRYLES